MSESDKPFTVKDRRHFTPEGDVREVPTGAGGVGQAGETPRASPTPDERPASPAAEAAPQAPPSAPAEGTSTRPGSSPGGDAAPADFGQFLLSLGAQAGMLLAGQGLPEGADAGEALAGARSIISILEMLKEKTEDRRTSQEDEILEGLLYELRMAYVETSRAGGS
jgi:hypothetical protein